MSLATNWRRTLIRIFRDDKQKVAGAPKSYLTFRVARQDLAMESAQVRGIVPLSEFVPLPRVRPGLLGVIALNGRLVNVIDLSSKLRLPACRPGSQPKIVVLEVTAGDHQH